MNFDINIVHTIFFYIIAAVAIIGALGVVFLPRIIYSVVSIVVTFLAVAGIFILANADFVGLAQIIIYAVALSIIFVFAIMLTGKDEDKKLWIAFKPRTLFAIAFSGLMFLIITFSVTNGLFLFKKIDSPFRNQLVTQKTEQVIKEQGTAGVIGQGLLKKYVLPFELLSVLLLVIILGVTVLANKDDEKMINPTTQKGDI